MEHKDHFSFGHVIRTLGFEGQFLVAFDVDSEDKYAQLSEVFFETEKGLQAFEVESNSINRNHTIAIKLKGISDHNAAAAFLKKQAYLPVSFLPPLSGNAFYLHEITGFTVQDSVRGKIGVVTGVTELPHQKLLEFEHNGKEVLMPILPEFYLGINRNERIILVNVPDGLLDVYSNPA